MPLIPINLAQDLRYVYINYLTVLFVGLIFICEYDNPLTIGEMSLFDKIQVSFFQSVTTRTAGFASVPQENLMSYEDA